MRDQHTLGLSVALRRIGAMFVGFLAGLARADGAMIHAVATGDLVYPVAEVRSVLLDLEGFDQWFPRLAQWQVLARGSKSARVYGRHHAPWPYRDRDYVVEYRWRTRDDGGFELEANAHSDASPVTDGAIRITELRSLWTLVSEGDRTLVRYEVTTAPPTRSPRWLEAAAQRRAGERLLAALERELARRQQRRPPG